MDPAGRRLASCDTAPKVVLGDLKIACRPPNGVAWISNCSRLESKPTNLVITCADGNYTLLGLGWRAWRSAVATAAGTARVNDSSPDCAGGQLQEVVVARPAREP